MEKRDKFSGEIIDINDDGNGVLKTNGEVIFVPNTCVGEQVSGIVINAKSKFAIGKCTEFLTKSPHRVEPACPYFPSCGGCDIQHLDYQTQLEFKQNKVAHLLKRVGGIDFDVKPTIPSTQTRYRNKIALPVNEKGEIGLYRKNSHNILPVEDCIISKSWIKQLIEIFSEYIQRFGVSGYDEKSHKGQIKHIVAREVEGSMLITIVSTTAKLPHLTDLESLLKTHFNNFGLNININTLQNNVILSDKFVQVCGIQELIQKENGISYPINNASFMQINDEIKSKIYSDVISNISSGDIVVNAYSGAGLLTAQIAQKAKFAYGIEIVEEASKSADTLAKNNNVTNMKNLCGDCAVLLPQLLSQLNTECTLVLDPPRKGCASSIIDAINQAKPTKIIYVSCDPNTLSRDIKLLSENFTLESVQPYDMFPQTAHVETLAILSLKN